MRKNVIIVVLVGFGFGLGLWFLASGPATGAAGGTITGVVKFAGDPPAVKEIPPTKDKQVCGKAPIFDESLVVDKASKGVQWALVSVEGAKGKGESKGATFDQQGCTFRPHVLVTPPGKVTVLNSDGILHNFHSHGKKNPALNQAQPGFRKKMEVEFKQAEIFKVTCDAHPWMTGWFVVSENPYLAVTDQKGSFKIENVPPGTYSLEIWHETLGPAKQQVTVKAGETVTVALELKK